MINKILLAILAVIIINLIIYFAHKAYIEEVTKNAERCSQKLNVLVERWK